MPIILLVRLKFINLSIGAYPKDTIKLRYLPQTTGDLQQSYMLYVQI